MAAAKPKPTANLELPLTIVEAQHLSRAIEQAQERHVRELERPNPALSRIQTKLGPVLEFAPEVADEDEPDAEA